VSDEFEALLRSGMAERVDAAPAFDDLGLADAAIAGAGRIRRQRRVAAAASGAGLLVLGAAAFVWQPWMGPGLPDDGVTAADTSAAEARSQLDMEFVVEDDDGLYNVINAEGDSVTLGDQEPLGVYRLGGAYLAESADEVWTTSFDGESRTSYPKGSDDTYLRVNEAGEQFAMITTSPDMAVEEYSIVNAAEANTLAEDEASSGAGGGLTDPVSFRTNYALTIHDWTDATVVFTADLYATTGGEPGTYYFNEQFDWGLESVGQAGFESVVIADSTDPNYLCVGDLEAGVGLAGDNEEICGLADSTQVEEYLAVASGGASDPIEISGSVTDALEGEIFPLDDADLGEYQTRFENDEYWWSDPLGRWQMSASEGDTTWLLIEATDDEPIVSELGPPPGALMPVLSYT
jgi:hypothetical protein